MDVHESTNFRMLLSCRRSQKNVFLKTRFICRFFYLKFGSIGQNMNLPSAKIWIICLLRFGWRKYSNSKSFLSRGGNLKQTQRYFSTEHRDNHNRVSNIPWININNKHNQTFSLQFMFKNYFICKGQMSNIRNRLQYNNLCFCWQESK